MRKVLLCFALFCLAACSQRAWIDRLASVEEQQVAVQVAQELRDGAVDKVVRRADPAAKEAVQRAALQVQPILAKAKGAFTIQTVNVVQAAGGPLTKSFVMEAGADRSWAVIEVVLQSDPRSLKLTGFRVWPATSQPSALHDFHFGKGGALGYLWMVLMCASAVTCITAVVLIWRRPWLGRRWLWSLGSLLGLGAFRLDWSTGAWGIQPIYFSLLGAGVSKAGPLAPWVLTFGLPVIAIVVIAKWFARRGPEHQFV